MAMAKSQAAQRRQSILFAAIERFAAKRSIRSDLKAGSTTALSATISGQVGNEPKIELEMSGVLSVGHPTEFNHSTAAPANEVVGALLAMLPAKQRVRQVRELRRKYAEDGTLAPEQKYVEEANALMQSLRSMKSKTRAGVVSFRSDS